MESSPTSPAVEKSLSQYNLFGFRKLVTDILDKDLNRLFSPTRLNQSVIHSTATPEAQLKFIYRVWDILHAPSHTKHIKKPNMEKTIDLRGLTEMEIQLVIRRYRLDQPGHFIATLEEAAQDLPQLDKHRHPKPGTHMTKENARQYLATIFRLLSHDIQNINDSDNYPKPVLDIDNLNLT